MEHMPGDLVEKAQEMEANWEESSGIIGVLKEMRYTTQFEPRFMPREWLGQILSSGRWSSSLYNNQPWYFVVIADRAAHKTLQEEVWRARAELKFLRPVLGLFNKSLRDPMLKFSFQKAKAANEVIFDHTVVIVACMDPSKPEAKASTSMALSNMALEATRLGLATAFTSATQSLNLLTDYKHKLGVPEPYKFFVSLMVGFPKRGLNFKKGTRKELGEISHWL